MTFTLQQIKPFLKEGCEWQLQKRVKEYLAYLDEYALIRSSMIRQGKETEKKLRAEYLARIGMKTGETHTITIRERDEKGQDIFVNKEAVLEDAFISYALKPGYYCIDLFFSIQGRKGRYDTLTTCVAVDGVFREYTWRQGVAGPKLPYFRSLKKNPAEGNIYEDVEKKIHNPKVHLKEVFPDVTELLAKMSCLKFGDGMNTIVLGDYRCGETTAAMDKETIVTTIKSANITQEGTVFLDCKEFVNTYRLESINGINYIG